MRKQTMVVHLPVGSGKTGSLVAAVSETLKQLPDVEIRPADIERRSSDRRFDSVILGWVKGLPVRFLLETRANAYPRDVRYSIWQLADARRLEQAVADVPLFAAPAISESSRQLLREHKISYWDAGGSLYVDLPWATYLIERPVPGGHARALRNVYRGSTAQVLHALLLNPTRSWHIGELADLARVSPSTAHQACTFLEQQFWMEKEGRGPRAVRVLRQPGAVLDAWAASYSLDGYQAYQFHRWTRNPDELLRAVTDALTSLEVEHALTLGSGTSFIAAHGTGDGHLWALVPESAVGRIEDVATAAGLHRVDEGETVTIFVARDRSPLLFRREVHGFWVASDVQLYLDLWAWPRRGKEQAQHLRAERLGF